MKPSRACPDAGVDEPTAASLCPHPPDRFLAAQEHALGVHSQRRVPFRLGQVLDPCDRDDACVLDRDVHLPERIAGERVERFDLGFVGDVAVNPAGSIGTAKPRGGLLNIRIHRGDDHPRAFADEAFRQGVADALVAARDDDRAVLKPFHSAALPDPVQVPCLTPAWPP
jgi:hypothetical protein